jgi:hypothetical protein
MSSNKELTHILTTGIVIASLAIVTPLAFAESAGQNMIISSSRTAMPMIAYRASFATLAATGLTEVAVGGAPANPTTGDAPAPPAAPSSPINEQSFDANGTINSVSHITTDLSYNLQGAWSLQVRDGTVAKFEADIDATPTSTALGKSHTHQLLNYAADQVGVLDSGNNFFTNGTVDIGTNNIITWSGVPVVITINDGATITITVDDSQAGHHFAGQPIVGTVELLNPCSSKPGPSMSVGGVCESTEGGAAATTGGSNTGNTSANANSSGGDQITVTIDSDTFGPNEIPQIGGKVNNGVSGTVAQVDVSDSSGKVVYNTVAGVTADGSFFTTLKTFAPGQYSVVVTYHGNTGTANFEVVETGTT